MPKHNRKGIIYPKEFMKIMKKKKHKKIRNTPVDKYINCTKLNDAELEI